MSLLAIDFAAWRCPECKRVVQVFSDAMWATCVGGWIMVQPVLIPWHEETYCERVPEFDTDPLSLLEAMHLLNQEKREVLV